MDLKKYRRFIINRYVLIIFFIVFYFAIRIPFFNTGWDGSDANGHDVDMFVNHPKNPNYLLIARINGKDVYASAFGHPAPMYEMFSQLGRVFQKFENYQNLSDAQIIYRAKVISAMAQLAIFLILLLMIFKNEKRNISLKNFLLYFALLVASITPISINNSNEFQIDSFFGLFMIGLYCLTLMAYFFKYISSRSLYALLFLTSAFLALGKNEWSLLLVFSLAASVFYLLFKKYWLKYDDDSKESFGIIFISFFGCFFGNVLSCLFEPALYWSGWNLLLNMSGHASILSKDGLGKLAFLTQSRFIFVLPMILMLVYVTYLGIKNFKKIDFVVVLCYFISLSFFASFFLSTWNSLPRYFAPSFIAIIITASMAYLKYQKPIANRTIILYGLLTLFVIYQSILYVSDENVKEQHTFGARDISSLVADKKCVVLIPVEDVYHKKEVDFVHTGMGLEAAQKIAKEKGLEICPLR